ncbi:MAG: FUSC family protein, partial [Tissierella sp.]|uniref:FUSC family protein n=1 Tax=Tissierella sp. TaxID=41274 RepID=UPI003F971214
TKSVLSRLLSKKGLPFQTLTLVISKFLNLYNPLLAGIAAIMTMEASVSETFNTGKFRIFGSVLGGIIALIITMILPVKFITTGIGILLVIHISNILNWKNAIRMALIVFIGIIIDFEVGYKFIYVLSKTLDTIIGVLIGTTINFLIRPPKIHKRIDSFIRKMIIEVRGDIFALVWEKDKIKLKNLQSDMMDIEQSYSILKKELKFNINKKETLKDYEDILKHIKNIQSHSRVIKLIGKRVYIDRENKKLLKEMFSKDVPKLEYTEEEKIDIIYNYHLKEMIYDFKYMENLYGDKR